MQEARESPEISILINGKPTRVVSATTLRELIRHLDLPERGIAIEVNGRIVPKSQWEKQRLNPGDSVDVVQMMGGG
jgi:sulfur carrier protein